MRWLRLAADGECRVESLGFSYPFRQAVEPTGPPVCSMRVDEACLRIPDIDQLCSFGPPRAGGTVTGFRSVTL